MKAVGNKRTRSAIRAKRELRAACGDSQIVDTPADEGVQNERDCGDGGHE